MNLTLLTGKLAVRRWGLSPPTGEQRFGNSKQSQRTNATLRDVGFVSAEAVKSSEFF